MSVLTLWYYEPLKAPMALIHDILRAARNCVFCRIKRVDSECDRNPRISRSRPAFPVGSSEWIASAIEILAVSNHTYRQTLENTQFSAA